MGLLECACIIASFTVSELLPTISFSQFVDEKIIYCGVRSVGFFLNCVARRFKKGLRCSYDSQNQEIQIHRDPGAVNICSL